MTNPQDSVYPILSDMFNVPQMGITKREYFAAMAMQGMLASPDLSLSNSDKIAKWAVQ